jgi:hypothetical protein
MFRIKYFDNIMTIDFSAYTTLATVTDNVRHERIIGNFML